MKIRKQEYGDANMIGRNVERLRKKKGIKQKDFVAKMQVMGCDINPTSYSKLEGQIRSVCDYELVAISEVLGVSINWLVGKED
jgi:transcriptional regulator with XRE-family HTH domain